MTEPARKVAHVGLPIRPCAKLLSNLRPTVRLDPRRGAPGYQPDRPSPPVSGLNAHRTPAAEDERFPAIRSRATGGDISTTQSASRRACAIAVATGGCSSVIRGLSGARGRTRTGHHPREPLLDPDLR